VVLGEGEIDGINDSKALGEGLREELFGEVLGLARTLSVVSFPAWWIAYRGRTARVPRSPPRAWWRRF
jgi:ribonuclease HII